MTTNDGRALPHSHVAPDSGFGRSVRRSVGRLIGLIWVKGKSVIQINKNHVFLYVLVGIEKALRLDAADLLEVVYELIDIIYVTS